MVLKARQTRRTSAYGTRRRRGRRRKEKLVQDGHGGYAVQTSPVQTVFRASAFRPSSPSKVGSPSSSGYQASSGESSWSGVEWSTGVEWSGVLEWSGVEWNFEYPVQVRVRVELIQKNRAEE